MSDIDREVAEKVMGWEVSYGRGWSYCRTDVPDDEAVWLVGDSWSPSTRIDHAWEVVEKLKARTQSANWNPPEGIDWHHGWGFELMYQSDEVPPLWLASFLRDDGCPVEAEAETAPLSICKAALAAVGEKQ